MNSNNLDTGQAYIHPELPAEPPLFMKKAQKNEAEGTRTLNLRIDSPML
jgi:hypothetical protein